MNVICLQLDIAWQDPDANYTRARQMLAECTPAPGDLVILPEMFASGYSMDIAKIAEAPDGGSAKFLAEISRQYQCWAIGGVATHTHAGKARNEAIATAPDGSEVVRYAKVYPFSYADETDYYEAGNTTSVLQIGEIPTAPVICYDLRFPELFRSAVRKGAEMFVVIASWPAERISHWTTLLQARAIENQAYVIGVNRCGMDPNCTYCGGTLIVGPKGDILTDAGDTERAVIASINPEAVRQWRQEFPALRDMRDDIL